MGFHLRYAKAAQVFPLVTPQAWGKVRVASTEGVVSPNLVDQASDILGVKFIPEEWLLSHATLVASVDTEEVSNVKLGTVQEGTRQIVRKAPDIRVIILSMHTDRRYVTGALDAGASGYLTKSCSFEELTRAIRLVHDNKTYLSPEISGIVIEASLGKSPPAKPSKTSVLSMREREVLQLLAEGKSVKQIASQLFISIKTVHTHRSQIMKKLNINSIAGLTRYAISEGITPLKS